MIRDGLVPVSEVDICYMVPTLEAGKENIIIRFVQRTHKNSQLPKANKIRVNTASLGVSDTDTPIYTDEHLTR